MKWSAAPSGGGSPQAHYGMLSEYKQLHGQPELLVEWLQVGRIMVHVWAFLVQMLEHSSIQVHLNSITWDADLTRNTTLCKRECKVCLSIHT